MDSVAKIVSKPVMVGCTSAAIVAVTPGHRMMNVGGYNVPNWVFYGLLAGGSSAIGTTAEVAIDGLLPDGIREMTLMGSRAVSPLATGGVMVVATAIVDGSPSFAPLVPVFLTGAISEVIGTYTWDNFIKPTVGML